MKRLILITLKDLRAIFLSPIFFVIASFFCLVLGWIFFNLLVTYLQSVHNHMSAQSQLTFSMGVLKPFFSNMNFLLVLATPVFTMRALAAEKERGTYDLLLSSALRPWELVIGKWLACWLSVLALVGLSLVIPMVLFFSNLPLGDYLASGYLGIFFNLTLYVSVGLLVSTLTANQSVAALLTLVGILFFWMIPWASQTSHNLILISIYKYLGVMTHFGGVLNGVLSSSSVFYYISSSVLFIGVAVFKVYRRAG